VKNINTQQLGSNPSQLRVLNGALYLAANNGVSGNGELIRIDASGMGSLVRDLHSGANGADIQGLTVVGSNLFFLALDDTNVQGLWKSDGTSAGTTLVRAGLGIAFWNNVNSTTAAASGGKYYFTISDNINGLELWVSDGTAAGTQRISNIEAGAGSSSPYYLTDVNGTLFFVATTSTGGSELYKSGGTEATTVLVRAIASGSPSSDPRELLNLNGVLYFTANDGASGRELWKSGGTSATTATVRNINTMAGQGSDPRNLAILGTTLYFFANSGSGYQLWKSDGTSAGTVRVSASFFNADYRSINSFNLININGTLYFSQQGPTTTELWKSNGSTVTKVTDLPSYYSLISEFANVGGVLYFCLGDGDASIGRDLWKSDGTSAGTILVRDVVPGMVSSNPRDLTAFNTNLYFIAPSDNIFRTDELWSSDGTPAGTISLELDPRTIGADISDLLLFNGKLYFAASDGVLGKELWTSNGTANGTHLVKDVNDGVNGGDIRALTEMGGNLYFFSFDNINGHGLWRSDGNGTGTILVRAFQESTFYFSSIISAGNRIYFNISSQTAGLELWSSNGNAAGTVQLRDINPGLADSSPEIRKQALIGNTFFFTAYDPVNGRELWKTNGTSAGTSLVHNINAGISDSNPDGLIVFNGALYFSAYDATYGRELWKTDGTTTTRVKNINPGAAGSNPQNFAIFQGNLYFTAADATGLQLWRTDGSTAGTTKVTSPDYSIGLMAQLTAVSSTLFFTTNDGSELWKTDGTMAGTSQMTGAPWASLGSSAALSDLTNVNGVLYFAATDSSNGRELWRSDGTADGTFRVTDLNPQIPLGAGLGNANPGNLTYDASRNKLFFTASNWQSGGEGYGNNELFSLDINNAPTDLLLSANNINENVMAGPSVSAFSSIDLDTGNTFTYSLVAGSGATDNGAFTIVGNQLRINASPDFETKNSYNMRVRTTDQGGLSFERALTVAVNNINEAPSDLVFGGSGSVNENAGPALVLGSLSTIDPDSPLTPQSFTYGLVSGSGDADNGAFSVIGNQLLLKASADFETKSSYSLRLRSTDQSGLFTDKVLSIAVNNLNDAPTDLALSASSVNENVAANSVVGTFSSVDQDAGNTFTYSLVAGSGATDNASFNIAANQLRINAIPNFEAKSSFSILVRSTDQSGAFVEKVLPISILNVNESPTNISLSASSVAENVAAGTLVGTLSSTDPDAPLTPQSFSYRLVAGAGSTDNAAFEIQENELRLRSSPDFELKSSYSIRVQTRDQGNRTFAKVFTISVININEAPTSGTDFFTASTDVDALQGLGGNDGFFVAISALNSGDSFDGGADTDQVTFSGGSSTQILTIDLNQANQLVSLTNGPAFATTPIFTGFEDVNLAGFAGSGVLIGNSEANHFTASSRKDTLTGNAGADTFALNALGHSLLTTFDVITEYTSIDQIDAPGTIAATLTSTSGNATSLSSAAIAAVLTSAAFPANSARAFTVTGQSGTFIALNNSTAGFSSTTDAILHLSNYSIGVANAVTIL